MLLFYDVNKNNSSAFSFLHLVRSFSLPVGYQGWLGIELKRIRKKRMAKEASGKAMGFQGSSGLLGVLEV